MRQPVSATHAVPLGVLLLILLDQGTKSWAQETLSVLPTLPVVPDLLHLTLRANGGAVLGLGRTSPFTVPLLILVGIGALLAVVLGYWLVARRFTLSWRLRLAVVGTVTALACTLLDRARLGYVVDFIEVRHLPVFNVADVLANVALLLFLLEALPHLRHRRGRAPAHAAPAVPPAVAAVRERAADPD